MGIPGTVPTQYSPIWDGYALPRTSSPAVPLDPLVGLPWGVLGRVPYGVRGRCSRRAESGTRCAEGPGGAWSAWDPARTPFQANIGEIPVYIS